LVLMGSAGVNVAATFVSQTGKVKEESKVHDSQINDLKLSADGTHFITASSDKTGKLVDTQVGNPQTASPQGCGHHYTFPVSYSRADSTT
jgi:WD40 repeat protein